jgi:hypothetical protein
MLVPDGHSPVVGRCRLEAFPRVTEDVALLIALYAARVEAKAVLVDDFAFRHDDAICHLFAMLVGEVELPEDSELVNVDADGFAKAVDATADDLHGECCCVEKVLTIDSDFGGRLFDAKPSCPWFVFGSNWPV